MEVDGGSASLEGGRGRARDGRGRRSKGEEALFHCRLWLRFDKEGGNGGVRGRAAVPTRAQSFSTLV